jgi:DNA-directed RNA polymerase subunit F
MILDRNALTMNEVKILIENIEDNEKKIEVESYLKKFMKTKSTNNEKMKNELENLGFLKIKNEHIIKIVDFIPEDASDLNKILVDTSLNEDETNKILEIVKNNK